MNRKNYNNPHAASGKKLLASKFIQGRMNALRLMLILLLFITMQNGFAGSVITCVGGVSSFSITSGVQANCSGGTGPTLTTTISTVSGGTGTAGQTYRVRMFKNTTGSTDTTASNNVTAGNSGTLNSKTVTTYDYIPTINTGGVFYYFAVVYTISNPAGCSAPLTAYVSSAVEVDVYNVSNAGLNRTVCKTLQDTIKLAANTPTSGTGAWTIASGPNTSVSQLGNVNGRTTTFTPSTPGVYVLTWTIAGNPAGCQTSNVTITQNSDASAGSNQTICSTTTSVTLAANTPVVGAGLWSVVIGSPNTSTTQFSDVTSPTATFTPGAGAGNYVLTWTLDNNSPCTASSNVTIIVNDPPTTANAGPNQTICSTATATLAANVPSVGSGFWVITSGPNTSTSQLSSTTDAAAVFTPTVSGAYNLRWRITNAPCSFSQNTVTITVIDPPTISNAGINQVICSGTAATLSANSPTTGSGVWSILAGSPSTQNSQFSNKFDLGATFTPNTTGVYTLRWTISNSPCAPSTSDITITVTPAVSAGSNQTICSNSTATLAASTPIVGAGVWSVDVSSPNTSTSQFNNTADPAAIFTPLSSGTYILIWTNTDYPIACQSANVTITVIAPPTTANAGPNQSICFNSFATLAGNTPSSGVGTWTITSGPNTSASQLSNINDPLATFTPSGGAGIYNIRWRITNSPCAFSQNAVTITVNDPPTTANAGSNISICSPDISASLNANSPGIGTGVWSVVSGSPNTSTAQFSSTTDPLATFTPTLPGIYTLRWTISNSGCTASSSDVIVSLNTQIWTGAISTDWNDASNWGGCGIVPTASDYVIINQTANQPEINAAAYCYSIELNNNSSLINNAALSITKNWNNNGTTFSGSGIVTFTGNGAIGGTTGTTFENLTLNSSVTTVLGQPIIVTGILSNAGKITTTNSLTVSGSYIHNQDGGTIPTATWTTGSNCNITGIISTAPNGIKTQTFYNFNWNCPNQNTFVNLALTTTITTFNGNFDMVNTNNNFVSLAVTYLPTLNISGNLIVDNGAQLEFCGGSAAAPTVNVSGDIIINNGGFLQFSSSNTLPSLNVAGNWTLNSGGTFLGNIDGVSTVTFNGTSVQTIGGTGITTFNNLVLNNSNGISLANDETITGTLTFTNGKISTASNTLTLGNAASVSGGGTGWVIGNLRRGISSTLDLATTFDIGDANNYLPVTLNFNGTPNNTGTITINQTAGQHPQISSSGLNTAKDVVRFWTITNDGNSVTSFTSYDATFTFLSGDVIGGANTSNFHVSHYDGSSWSSTTNGTMSSTTSQCTGLTTFSDFAIGEGCVVPVASINNNSGTTNLTCTTTSIHVNATGGNSYAWSGGSTTNTASNTFSSPNTYTVTVTNTSGGCTATTSIDITQDITPVVATSVQGAAIACNAGTTTVTVSATSGTAPFTGTGVVSSVHSGSYTYTVTGANGCTNSTSISITQPTVLTFTTVVTNVAGCGTSTTTGSISVSASGGTGTKVYSKDNGTTYQGGTLFGNLSATNYQVKVRDANGCITAPSTNTVGTSSGINFTATTVNATNCSTANGKITISATGGAGVYNYSKNGGTLYQSSNIFNTLTSGTYSIRVKDPVGCYSTITAVHVGPNCREDNAMVEANNAPTNNISCYPNPAANQATVSFNTDKAEAVTMRLFDVTGGMVFSQDYNAMVGENQFQLNLAELSKGIYLIVIQNSNGILQKKLVVE